MKSPALPSIARRSAQVILAEIGLDMDRFPSVAHLCSWAGMSPGNHQSAGKRKHGRTNKGNKTLKSMLAQCAKAAGKVKNSYFYAQFQGIRPTVPCHHIREYRYAYGAVEPATGESCFLVLPYCNTVCTNIFLQALSEQYKDDLILLCCDRAAWHKAKALVIPDNIRFP